MPATSFEYTQANIQYAKITINLTYSLTGITIVFLICMVLEFLIMFTGVTLFNDRGNLVQMSFHIFGIVATSLFILDSGHYYELWKIWIVGG